MRTARVIQQGYGQIAKQCAGNEAIDGLVEVRKFVLTGSSRLTGVLKAIDHRLICPRID
jgi:hypothetical protein